MKISAFKTLKVVFIVMVAFFAFSAPRADANTPYAVGGCNFSRDLVQGMRGEDVRCLQQYLKDNAQGMNFVYPDGVFGSLTRQAVINWQIKYGLPPIGIFESLSRAKYFELTGVVNGGGWDIFGNDTKAQRAIDRINEALEMIEDAEDEIDDSNQNTTSAKTSLEEAKDDMIDAVKYFFLDRNFNKAFDRADDAFDNAEDAFEKAGGKKGSRSRAENAIEDAEDAINEARDDIEYAEDRGRDVNEAEDLLDDAEEKLDDAQDEFDDRDYDDAERLAKDAEELADDAVDAIN